MLAVQVFASRIQLIQVNFSCLKPKPKNQFFFPNNNKKNPKPTQTNTNHKNPKQTNLRALLVEIRNSGSLCVLGECNGTSLIHEVVTNSENVWE